MSDILKMIGLQRSLLLIGLIVGISTFTTGQHVTYDQYRSSGNLAFLNKDYFNAFRFYSESLAFHKKDSLSMLQKAGESAMYAWRLDTARHFFERLLNYSSDRCDSSRIKNHYYLALVYQRMSEDSLALETLKEVDSACINSFYSKEIDLLFKSTEWAMAHRGSRDITIVEVPKQADDSTEHALAPVYFDKDTLLFTRQFFCSTCPNDFVHQMGEIRVADSTVGTFFSDELGGKKTDSIVGFLTFNHDKTRIYYAECRAINTLDQQCQIVTRTITGDSLGSKQVVLTGILNDSITFTHPNYIRDTLDTLVREGLYLVSNRPGGKRGSDIWFGWLKDGTKIVSDSLKNLKRINSAANEISPFYDTRTRGLYYSSDRLDGGKSYGGMDIYHATGKIDWVHYDKDTILHKPINSSKNDIFYITRGDTSWFSSNRTNPYDTISQYDACCYDLFTAIDTMPKNCQVYFCPKIWDYCSADSIDIDEVNVELFQSTGPDSTRNKIPFDSVHKGFPVDRGANYILTAEKDGYEKGTLKIEIDPNEFQNSPRGEDCCQSCCELFLRPLYSKLTVLTEHSCFYPDSTYALYGCTVLLTDGDRKVLCVEKSDSTYHFIVQELKTYTLEVRHPEFGTQRSSISMSYQQRDSCHMTIKIIMNKEISLYFENDVPGPVNRSDTLSSQIYTNTWVDNGGTQSGYASLSRQAEYKSWYDKDTASVDSFFQKMWQEIVAYEALKQWMFEKFSANPKDTVVLMLEGRASPLADEHYNMALSQRRIDSVIRDIKKDGKLRRFSNNIFIEKNPGPRGEEESQFLGISDDKNNLKESIYSPKAAEERRITVRILHAKCLKHHLER